MLAPRNRVRYLPPLVIVLSLATALLASGCVWGVVTDAETGDAIAGATVSYIDVNGDSASTMTDANGLYAFDIAAGPFPAAGPVSFQVNAFGYHPKIAARLIEYNDSPNASADNLSSFWEVQSFNLISSSMKLNEVETISVDIRKVKSPPLIPGASARYFVRLRAYAQDDPTTPVCDERSGWQTVLYPDPPTMGFSLNCSAPGPMFRATVTVTVERVWPSGGGVIAEDDTSTAELPWVAPGDTWAFVWLDSADSEGPDDPDLEFDASVRYRALTIVPLAY